MEMVWEMVCQMDYSNEQSIPLGCQIRANCRRLLPPSPAKGRETHLLTTFETLPPLHAVISRRLWLVYLQVKDAPHAGHGASSVMKRNQAAISAVEAAESAQDIGEI